MAKQQQILIVRGALDEKKLNSIAAFDGAILATGKVTFKTEVTVPCGLIALGDLEAKKLNVKGSLVCESKCNVEDLNVDGDLSVVQKGTEIKHLTLSGSLISDKDKAWCNIYGDIT